VAAVTSAGNTLGGRPPESGSRATHCALFFFSPRLFVNIGQIESRFGVARHVGALLPVHRWKVLIHVPKNDLSIKSPSSAASSIKIHPFFLNLLLRRSKKLLYFCKVNLPKGVAYGPQERLIYP
jgi:hypothetical protein